MAHFARIEDGIVVDVIVVDNSDILDDDGNQSEDIGKAFCTNLLGGNWLQTSYNGIIRKNYASIGDVYNETLDAFIYENPFPSWVFNETTCQYDPPVARPTDTKVPYQWDEDNQVWAEVSLIGD